MLRQHPVHPCSVRTGPAVGHSRVPSPCCACYGGTRWDSRWDSRQWLWVMVAPAESACWGPTGALGTRGGIYCNRSWQLGETQPWGSQWVCSISTETPALSGRYWWLTGCYWCPPVTGVQRLVTNVRPLPVSARYRCLAARCRCFCSLQQQRAETRRTPAAPARREGFSTVMPEDGRAAPQGPRSSRGWHGGPESGPGQPPLGRSGERGGRGGCSSPRLPRPPGPPGPPPWSGCGAAPALKMAARLPPRRQALKPPRY